MKVDVKFERGDSACVLYSSNAIKPKIVFVKIYSIKIEIGRNGQKVIYSCSPHNGGNAFDVTDDNCIFHDIEEMLRALGKLH